MIKSVALNTPKAVLASLGSTTTFYATNASPTIDDLARQSIDRSTRWAQVFIDRWKSVVQNRGHENVQYV